MQSVRAWIRDLSDRGEFLLVFTITFGYEIAVSAWSMFARRGRFEFSTWKVWDGILLEISILIVVGCVLHIRGWRLRLLGGRLTWQFALAGIPLFLWYMLLYWGTGIAIVLIYPDAAKMRLPMMIHSASPALLLLFVCINSVFEEFMVAGYVIQALEDHGAAFAITASTLIRFSYHLYQGPIATISILPLGLLFGYVYWRWRNLWPLVVAHTIMNIISVVMARQ